MKKFPAIPNKDFVYFGYRAEPYFTSSVIAGGLSNKANLKKHFQLSRIIEGIFVHYDFFNLHASVKAFDAELRKKLENAPAKYVDSVVRGCFQAGDRLLAASRRIHAATKAPSLSRQQMIKLLKAYYKEAYHYCIYYIIAWFDKPERLLAERLAKKYASNEGGFRRLLELITTPSRETAAEHEQDDFLRLCIASQNKGTDVKKRAADHAKKYGWLSVRYFIGQPWTAEDVTARLKTMDTRRAKSMLEDRLAHRKETAKNLRTTMAKMTPSDRHCVKQIRDVIFLRTQRADFYHHSSYYVQPLVKKIAQTVHMDFNDLLNFSPLEIIDGLRGKLDLGPHVAPRRECMITYHNSTSLCLEGDEAKAYIRARPALQRTVKATSSVTGTTAFPGKIRGRAKIVLSNEDLNTVKKGDILVTTMTTPNFIAAMERAAAFVTDEGGILCHAAIISREMKKPCIIAAKIATKIFKNGDVVDLDATTGTITIHTRA